MCGGFFKYAYIWIYGIVVNHNIEGEIPEWYECVPQVVDKLMISLNKIF